MYVCVYVHVQKRQNVLEHKEDEKKGGGIKIKKGNRQDIRAQGPVLNYCTGGSCSHTPRASLFLPLFPCHTEENFYCGYPGMKEEKIFPTSPGQYIVVVLVVIVVVREVAGYGWRDRDL